MAKVMSASEFIKKLNDVAKNHKTLYVMGCFGAPMNATNKKRYINHHEYNARPTRTNMINRATADTFGFDCVGLLKGVLWGWNGDKLKTYGGAKYAANGVPDISADGMIKVCSGVSTDFNDIKIGEAVWTNGHIGVYIGDGLAIECTPSGTNNVQITACNCTKTGYRTRKWKKHGMLPYIEYDASKPATISETSTTSKSEVKVDHAYKCNKTFAGTYQVTAKNGLHIRTGANTKKTSIGILKYGDVVSNYGYYSIAPNGAVWLYVKTSNGVIGFCSSKYLKRM